MRLDPEKIYGYRARLDDVEEAEAIRATVRGSPARTWPLDSWEAELAALDLPVGTKVRLEALNEAGKPLKGCSLTLDNLDPLDLPEPRHRSPAPPPAEVVEAPPAPPAAPLAGMVQVDSRQVHVYPTPELQIVRAEWAGRVDVATLQAQRDVLIAQGAQLVNLSGKYAAIAESALEVARSALVELAEAKADRAYASAKLENPPQDPATTIALSEHQLVRDGLSRLGDLLSLARGKPEELAGKPLAALPDSLKEG